LTRERTARKYEDRTGVEPVNLSHKRLSKGFAEDNTLHCREAIDAAQHSNFSRGKPLSPLGGEREVQACQPYIAAIRLARRRASGVAGSGAGAVGIRPLSRGSHQSHSSAPIW